MIDEMDMDQFIKVDVPVSEDMESWFEHQAREHQDHELRWLLVHADDGVIWGEIRNGKLVLSNTIDGPVLRCETIQTAYLFSDEGELFLWKDENSELSARLTNKNDREFYDESYLLWGTKFETMDDGFTKCIQGTEGLCHIVPLKVNDGDAPKIKVRHFLDYDKEGCVYIKYSRLVSLELN